MQTFLLIDTKKLYAAAVLFCFATNGIYAQTKPAVKPSATAQPATQQPSTISSGIRTPDAVTDIRERLVQLALQNPMYEIADRNLTIRRYQVKAAKNSWLSHIALQGNFNEFAFQKGVTSIDSVTGVKTTTNPSSFYPKYNAGINIPFDIFSRTKNEVKIAKENLSIAQAEKNQHFREIKAEVLTKYEDYILYQQRLDLQIQVTQDARTVYLSAEKDFQEGAIKQEDYNRSYRGYTDEKIKQAEALRNLNVIKLEMEKIIGVSMEDVLKNNDLNAMPVRK